MRRPCSGFHVKPFPRACFGLVCTAARHSLATRLPSQAPAAFNGSVRWQKSG